METEINLIKAMVDVLIYNETIAETPNKVLQEAALEILQNKVLDIQKVLRNPSYKGPKNDDDLIEFTSK